MGTQTRATMPEKRKRDGPGDGNDDEEGEFEVEEISKKRKNNGRLEYFVKWKVGNVRVSESVCPHPAVVENCCVPLLRLCLAGICNVREHMGTRREFRNSAGFSQKIRGRREAKGRW